MAEVAAGMDSIAEATCPGGASSDRRPSATGFVGPFWRRSDPAVRPTRLAIGVQDQMLVHACDGGGGHPCRTAARSGGGSRVSGPRTASFSGRTAGPFRRTGSRRVTTSSRPGCLNGR
jgi:hypothetical protein